MLKTKKTMTLTGQTVIDGVVAENHTATIDSSNPNDISISSFQQDKTVYKENRIQCRADKAEFEDMVYTLQDEMIAERTGEE